MPQAAEPKLTDQQWERLEDAFRVHAFGLYYRRCFRSETDPLARFAKALFASAQPIRDRAMLLEWHRRREARRAAQRAERRSSRDRPPERVS